MAKVFLDRDDFATATALLHTACERDGSSFYARVVLARALWAQRDLHGASAQVQVARSLVDSGTASELRETLPADVRQGYLAELDAVTDTVNRHLNEVAAVAGL